METNLEKKTEFKFSKVRFFIILLLILIGISLCVELSYIFYKTNFLEAYIPSFCTVSELIDCDGVAKTSYSLSMGVPNALWGLLLYLVMLMLLFVDRIQAKFKNTIFDVFENPSSYIATLALLSFAISMVLAFISIFKIHKICALCFCTYFVDLFIAFAARGKGFFFDDIKTTVKDFIKGAKKYFVLFIIVLVAFVSTLVYLDRSLVLSPKLKKERTMKEFYEAPKNKYAIKGNTLGNKNAKVVVNVYSDFNCPFCRVLNIMLHKIARENKIVVNEINFPLDTSCNNRIGMTLGGHENSCVSARYALAAKKQGKFWGVANVLFDKRPRNPEEITEQIRKAHLGIDLDKLTSDANSPEIIQELQKDIEKSSRLNLNGTPALEINDVFYMGGMPYEDLVEKINLALKRAEN